MSFLYVKVYHGPCTTMHSSIHKPQLLHGFQDLLQRLGFRVVLVPVEFDNYCMFEMCGHEVFRCNLRYLKFNTECCRDVVCRRAVEAVIQAAVKFRRARPVLWFWTLMDHQLFKRSKFFPQDFWAKDVKFDISSIDCVTCCNTTLLSDANKLIPSTSHARSGREVHVNVPQSLGISDEQELEHFCF